jgi:hypothetical protein
MTNDIWLTSYVIDQLYFQMCDGPLVDHSCDVGCKYLVRMSFHYVEADNYCRRISVGDFKGRNAKYKPVFTIDATKFTPELREELKTAGESLNRIVTEAVF